MAKTIKFNKAPHVLMERALKRVEREEYIPALELINMACDSMSYGQVEDDVFFAVMLEKANIYQRLGLIEQALFEYYRIFDCNFKEEVYLGIVNCFIKEGMLEHAIYYLGQGLSREDIGDADELEFYQQVLEHKFGFVEKKQFRLVQNKEDEVFDYAKSMMRAGNEEGAISMLSLIKPGEAHHKEACCMLALIYMGTDRLKQAENRLSAVVDNKIGIRHNGQQTVDDNNDLLYLATTMQLHYLKGDFELAKIIARQIDSYGFSDIVNLRRVVSAMTQVGEDKLAYKYCQLILTQDPYDKEFLMLSAIAAHNLALYNVAKNYFVLLATLNPKSIVYKEYCKIVEDPEVWVYTTNMQKKQIRHNIEEIENILRMPQEEKLVELLNHKGTVRWLFSSNSPLCSAISIDIAQDEAWEDFVKDLLLSFDIGANAQRLLLNFYLLSRTDKYRDGHKKENKLNINFENYITELYPVCPSNFNKMKKLFVEAYWFIFTHLVTQEEVGFEKSFCQKFELLIKKIGIQQKNMTDFPALCALIAYHYKQIPTFRSKKGCIKFFGADSDVFEAYLAMIKVNKEKGW